MAPSTRTAPAPPNHAAEPGQVKRPIPSILSIITGSESYGTRRVWEEVIRGFTKKNIHVTALILHSGQIDTAIAACGVPVLKSGLPPFSSITAGNRFRKFLLTIRRCLQQAKAFPHIRAAIRQTNATALLVQLPAEVILAGLAARSAGIKAYWLMPNTVSDRYPLHINRKIYHFAFRHLNIVPVANSHHTLSTLGKGSFESHMCHLGADPRIFDPETPPAISREDFDIPHDALILGVVARLEEEKGQHRLLQALAALDGEAHDIHLMFCGDLKNGKYRNRLQSLSEHPSLKGRVHFAGHTEDTASYYKICDVIVSSSLYAEPFGLSVVEAMMTARPVLAHKAGGPGETVIDGITGWHIQGPDRKDFEQALRRMIADRSRHKGMGEAARKHALARFTTDRMLADLEKIIIPPASAEPPAAQESGRAQG